MFPFVYRIDSFGWMHLVNFGVFIPLLAVLGRKRMMPSHGPLPDRGRHLRHTAFGATAFGGMSLFIAHVEGMDLFPRAFSWVGAMAGIVVLAAAVAGMRPRWRRAVAANVRVVHLYMPSTVRERAWWIAVAFLAGAGEEITWRGVQWALLANLTGSYSLAALLCAVMFGVAHMVQGWRTAVVIVGFSLAFHLLVWIAGSLYVAMAVHIAYDVMAGLTYGRLGRELGYAPAVEAPAG